MTVTHLHDVLAHAQQQLLVLLFWQVKKEFSLFYVCVDHKNYISNQVGKISNGCFSFQVWTVDGKTACTCFLVILQKA